MQRTKFYNDSEQIKLNSVIAIPIEIYELLLEDSNPADLIALYSFLIRKADLQKTNCIKISSEHIQIRLQWSLMKVRKVKNQLKSLNLIEDVVVRDDKRFVGNFILLKNYIGNNPMDLLSSQTEQFLLNVKNRLTDSHNGADHGSMRVVGNFLLPNNYAENETSEMTSSRTAHKYIYRGENSLDVISPEKKEKIERKEIPPTLEQVTKYCQLRKNNINPQSFIDFYDSKGWVVGKSKMKDWQAAIRTWEHTEKKSTSPIGTTKFKVYDGIKYRLCPDGMYRDASGEPYIE